MIPLLLSSYNLVALSCVAILEFVCYGILCILAISATWFIFVVFVVSSKTKTKRGPSKRSSVKKKKQQPAKRKNVKKKRKQKKQKKKKRAAKKNVPVIVQNNNVANPPEPFSVLYNLGCTWNRRMISGDKPYELRTTKIREAGPSSHFEKSLDRIFRNFEEDGASAEVTLEFSMGYSPAVFIPHWAARCTGCARKVLTASTLDADIDSLVNALPPAVWISEVTSFLKAEFAKHNSEEIYVYVMDLAEPKSYKCIFTPNWACSDWVTHDAADPSNPGHLGCISSMLKYPMRYPSKEQVAALKVHVGACLQWALVIAWVYLTSPTIIEVASSDEMKVAIRILLEDNFALVGGVIMSWFSYRGGYVRGGHSLYPSIFQVLPSKWKKSSNSRKVKVIQVDHPKSVSMGAGNETFNRQIKSFFGTLDGFEVDSGSPVQVFAVNGLPQVIIASCAWSIRFSSLMASTFHSLLHSAPQNASIWKAIGQLKIDNRKDSRAFGFQLFFESFSKLAKTGGSFLNAAKWAELMHVTPAHFEVLKESFKSFPHFQKAQPYKTGVYPTHVKISLEPDENVTVDEDFGTLLALLFQTGGHELMMRDYANICFIKLLDEDTLREDTHPSIFEIAGLLKAMFKTGCTGRLDADKPVLIFGCHADGSSCFTMMSAARNFWGNAANLSQDMLNRINQLDLPISITPPSIGNQASIHIRLPQELINKASSETSKTNEWILNLQRQIDGFEKNTLNSKIFKFTSTHMTIVIFYVFCRLGTRT